MLGHKSATMTLDLYGHLFPDRLDTVADAMDAARTVALNVATEPKLGRDADGSRPLLWHSGGESKRPLALRFRRPEAVHYLYLRPRRDSNPRPPP